MKLTKFIQEVVASKEMFTIREEARIASEDKLNYRRFCYSLITDMEVMPWDIKIGIVNQFLRYLKKPRGKGWCFDWDTIRWFRIRKLTPRECFRLMDVDEERIDQLMVIEFDKKGREKQVISNSQLYKMAGNSIVVSCLELIFKNLFTNKEREYTMGEQMSLF